jgi:hypothetical protein
MTLETIDYLITTRWFWPIVFLAIWGLLIPALKPYIKSLLARIFWAQFIAVNALSIGETIGTIARCGF